MRDGEGYEAVGVSGESVCGLNRGGAVDCWAHEGLHTDRKEGPYTTISAGYAHHCGVLATGDIHCWEIRSSPTQCYGNFFVDGGDFHCRVRNGHELHLEEVTYPANGET